MTFVVDFISRSADIDVEVLKLFISSQNAEIVDSPLLSMFEVPPHIAKVTVALNVAVGVHE